ncbi:hypothetical protein LguiB_021608 [Lonicera macranthoides]
MEWFQKITHPCIQPLDLRKISRRIRGPQQGANSLGYNMCAKKQAGIVAALALLEGIMFGGQTHDSNDAINKVDDILKALSVDNEEEDRRPESGTKNRHAPTATAPAPAVTIPAPSRAKSPSKKRPKK